MQLEDLPAEILDIVKDYKKQMEELDRFHLFLHLVFSNLCLALKEAR